MAFANDARRSVEKLDAKLHVRGRLFPRAPDVHPMRENSPARDLAGKPDPTVAATDRQRRSFVASRDDLNDPRFGRGVDRLPVLGSLFHSFRSIRLIFPDTSTRRSQRAIGMPFGAKRPGNGVGLPGLSGR
jgi:hypothetical protein